MRLGVEAALVDGALVPGDVEVVDGRIARVGLASANGRGIAAPGFIDLQVNGFAGVDFLEADAAGYRRAGEAMLETGVTGYLPTLITTPEDELVAAMREMPIVAEGPRDPRHPPRGAVPLAAPPRHAPAVGAARPGARAAPAAARRRPGPDR